jgi:hypothetical protein
MTARRASRGSAVPQPPVGLRLYQCWCAVRVGLWLCRLPRRLRRQSVPGLLHQLTAMPGRATSVGPLELEQAVRVVRRVCRLRCFRTRPFPQTCVRQALALYYVCSQLGSPVAFHIGVRRVGDGLRGHSWVTLGGIPLGETRDLKGWSVAYTYPVDEQSSTHRTPECRGDVEERGGGQWLQRQDESRRDMAPPRGVVRTRAHSPGRSRN